MIQIVFVDPTGKEHKVEAEPGQSVMQAAVGALVPGIEASCGGNCICATCHAHIDERWFAQLPPPDAIEASMLECTAAPQPTSRLTCQVQLSEALDGMVVRIAASQH
ncbi:MAG: 2Fe-2S iron-sulfur cluster-binding protein [Panacagrimonas sp.]